MSIIQRITRILNSHVGDALDKAENPEKMLKQRIRELEKTIADAKQAFATFNVSFKKTTTELEQLKRLRDEWQHKAEKALALGDEETARKSLSRKIEAEERIAKLSGSFKKSKATHSDMKDSLRTLQDRLNNAKLQLSELQSRKSTATAEMHFGKSVEKFSGLNNEDPDLAKMEEEVLELESLTEVERDMRNGIDGIEEQDKKTKELEIDSELQKLKDKIKE